MNTIPAWAIRTKADEHAIKTGCYWDETRAQAIITFAHQLFKPQFISGKFVLLPWQTEFLQSLYGWRLPNGNRRFKTCNLHIAKKNGKTLLVSILSAYELLKSEEPSPYVVTGSVSRDNASQVFSEIRHTLTKAKLTKFCKVTANSKKIRIDRLNAQYISLASDGDRVQGYNCSFVALDELHAFKNSSLYDALKYATIARDNGLIVMISTAGDDVAGFYHGIYSKSKRILKGEDLDTTHAAWVFESKNDADSDDVEEWKKANPSLGVSFSKEQFALDMQAAKNDPSEWNRFQRYRLNRWVRPDETAYFNVTTWHDHKLNLDDNQLKNFDAWVAVDLSLSTDPSSISIIFALPMRQFYVKSWSYVAREGVKKREKSSLPRYEDFANQGWMTITDGDRIDDIAVYSHLIDLTNKYRVKKMVFDPYSAMIMMGMLEREGIPVATMTQSARYYSAPMKEFQKAIIEGRIKNDGNNWLRYCLQNVRVDEDKDGRIRPKTKTSLDHIDSALATLMAYSQAAPDSIGTSPSYYDANQIMWI